ncbi:MAG TPA: [acyl-carrier-protein] S-malonyltransferase [Deltaproteobacteria bacterium]|nr:[acyl-carrier-protein] S-malonyltransferase [Deltaproteobacteria bacterium]HCP48170.1 [acyl-carrier-protein] S-malonyltransferase [Deltaproteobacteria bacterium]
MPIAYVFPGQGSQQVGMGQAWLDREDCVRSTFAEADEALGDSLSTVILEGPIEALTKTENTQPALLTVSVAYWRVLEAHGLQPDVVAGHSLGEYSALVCAGALSFADAVRLTRLRGQAMQSAVPLGEGTMAAIIGIRDPAVVESICEEAAQGQVVEPAGFNTPGQVVIAGHVDAVDRACAIAKERRGIPKKLNVSAPFHCALLVPAGEQLEAALADVDIQTPRVPYVPNVTAQWCVDSEPDTIRRHLVEQVSKPVLWQQTMQTLADNGVDRWLEVGAGKTLCGLVRRFDRKAEAAGFEDEAWQS